MQFHKIRITKWRDKSSPRRPAASATELASIDARMSVVAAHLAAETERAKRLESNVAQVEALRKDLADLEARRAAIVAPEEKHAGELEAAAGLHPMVTKTNTGYQVIDEKKMEVVKLVDASGNEFSKSAVYEYDIVEADAPAPPWATAKLAEWFPPKPAEAPQPEGEVKV